MADDIIKAGIQIIEEVNHLEEEYSRAQELFYKFVSNFTKWLVR